MILDQFKKTALDSYVISKYIKGRKEEQKRKNEVRKALPLRDANRNLAPRYHGAATASLQPMASPNPPSRIGNGVDESLTNRSWGSHYLPRLITLRRLSSRSPNRLCLLFSRGADALSPDSIEGVSRLVVRKQPLNARASGWPAAAARWTGRRFPRCDPPSTTALVRTSQWTGSMPS